MAFKIGDFVMHGHSYIVSW